MGTCWVPPSYRYAGYGGWAGYSMPLIFSKYQGDKGVLLSLDCETFQTSTDSLLPDGFNVLSKLNHPSAPERNCCLSSLKINLLQTHTWQSSDAFGLRFHVDTKPDLKLWQQRLCLSADALPKCGTMPSIEMSATSKEEIMLP